MVKLIGSSGFSKKMELMISLVFKESRKIRRTVMKIPIMIILEQRVKIQIMILEKINMKKF